MNKKKNFKIKKSHNKIRFYGKQIFYINYDFFKKLIIKYENIQFKRRRKFRQKVKNKLLFLKLRVINFIKKFNFNTNILCLFDKLLYRYITCFLISLVYYKITDYQLELIRRIAKRIFGKKSFIKLLIKAQFILIKRTNQIRMGGGKGNKLFKIIYPLYPGCIFFESRGIRYKIALNFYKLLKKKISFKCKLLCFNRI